MYDNLQYILKAFSTLFLQRTTIASSSQTKQSPSPHGHNRLEGFEIWLISRDDFISDNIRYGLAFKSADHFHTVFQRSHLSSSAAISPAAAVC